MTKFNINENPLILEKYLRIIFNTYFSNVKQTSIGYNFKCNVCGDSKKSKRKTRGWILKDRIPWLFYCHNCGASFPTTKWIKQYYPDIYRDFLKEVLCQNNIQNTFQLPQLLSIRKKAKVSNSVTQNEFVPILKGNDFLFFKAKQLCEHRRIPEIVWKKWYVAIDGTYKNRLIIPFYDNENKIYYFQARTLFGFSDNKYINMLENREEAIYNFYHVDKSKPIIATEGIIDSLFIENSIALLGTKWPQEVHEKIKDLNIYYLLDCDQPGKDKSLELLYKGFNVFLWKKFVKDYYLPKREKWDINDICLFLNKDKFTFEELEKYFNSSIVQGVWV
jgi:hypothetical protein